jgi:histone deacetylase HOS3
MAVSVLKASKRECPADLDFDLDGTQAIAWRINADTVRHDLEVEAKSKLWRTEQERKNRKGRKSGGASAEGSVVEEESSPPQDKRGLRIFYGSLHDIESFPCEDGNKELVTDASMCIEGAHGQWIWNSESHFSHLCCCYDVLRLKRQQIDQVKGLKK